MELIIDVIADNPCAAYDLTTYYTRNISYDLTAIKREGMTCFLNYIQKEATGLANE